MLCSSNPLDVFWCQDLTKYRLIKQNVFCTKQIHRAEHDLLFQFLIAKIAQPKKPQSIYLYTHCLFWVDVNVFCTYFYSRTCSALVIHCKYCIIYIICRLYQSIGECRVCTAHRILFIEQNMLCSVNSMESFDIMDLYCRTCYALAIHWIYFDVKTWINMDW